jgi:hypothetical protein
MLEFFIENTFAMLSGRVFQQTVGIPMSTNYTPLLRDLFFYSYVWWFVSTLAIPFIWNTVGPTSV